MNWRHSPPVSTGQVFRFVFAKSSIIVRLLFVCAFCSSFYFRRACLDTGSRRKSWRQLPPSRPQGILIVRETAVHMPKRPTNLLLTIPLLLAGLPALSFGHTPQAPKKLPAGPPAPQSTHYPI